MITIIWIAMIAAHAMQGHLNYKMMKDIQALKDSVKEAK